MRHLWVVLVLAIGLGGCANLPFGVKAPSTAANSALARAVRLAGQPPERQRVVCADARKRLQGRRNTAEARFSLAVMGIVVPGCLAPDDVRGLLKGSPDTPLAAYLRVLFDLQSAQRQRLAQMRDKVASLQAKLKAMTRIEQQLNQVNNLELQYQYQGKGQGKTAPR